MTGNPLWDLVISVLGIALVVGLIRLMFPAVASRFIESDILNYLKNEEPDFVPVHWHRGENLVLLADRDWRTLLIVRPLTGYLIHRRLAFTDITLSETVEGTTTLDLKDRTFGRVDLGAGLSPQWRQQLTFHHTERS